MTPYEAVKEEFDFPFELRPFQVTEVIDLSEFHRAGFYWEPGAGKTVGSIVWALYHMLTQGVNYWICPMPPILTLQWARFIGRIRYKRTGQPLSALVYEGTPAKRAKLDLDHTFILMSYGLLKNDQRILSAAFDGVKYGVIADEAHAIKNIESQTHRTVRDMAEDRPLALLTGTPLTTPGDAYAYMKLIAPGVYRNHRQFENIHVQERDEYDKVTKWQNLELLATNMKVHASRVLRREVINDLPPVIFTKIDYDLDPAHLKLYNRIADEQLVEFEDGREINAISAQALRAALQQIIVNYGEFADDDSLEPAALTLIHEVFEEIGPTAKLAVVAHFVRSNAYLVRKLKQYGVVAIYGDVSPSNKQKAIARFIDDPSCRCILLQPASAGFGVDGLQHVCSDMLVLEAPTISPPFDQVVKRLDRDGQTQPVNCRVAVANKTVQVRMFKSLLENDATVNAVQGGFKDLKDMIHGN